MLDDLEPDDVSSVASIARALERDLGAFLSRVIVTTRELTSSEMAELGDALLLGSRDLAMSEQEAADLAAQCAVDLDAHAINQLRRSCSGHPALLRLALLESTLGNRDLSGSEPALATVGLIERLIEAHFDGEDRAVLETASLLKYGLLSDLEVAGISSPIRRARRIADLLPLVRIASSGLSQQMAFTVHDLVGDCLVHRIAARGRAAGDNVIEWSLRVLADRGDWERAEALLILLCDSDDRVRFVSAHGGTIIEGGDYGSVLRLLGSVPLHRVMSEPRCLLYWSQALLEVGDVSGSVAKAAAAIRLAQHDGDRETLGLAMSQQAQAWLDQGKAQEAADAFGNLLANGDGGMGARVRCEVLITYASALVVTDRRTMAANALQAAESLASELGAIPAQLAARLERVRAYAFPLWWGDYATGVRQTAPLLDATKDGYLSRQSIRGNLAWMLLEVGRLSRAESLLEHVLNSGNPLLEASYLPLVGLIKATRGDLERSRDYIAHARATAAEYGDAADMHVNGLYEACVMRSFGDSEGSLDLAERSFEGLSRQDFLGNSRLAATEVACSLLALGDGPGARGWIGPTAPPDDDSNKYHGLCAAMVLAVADCREGLETEAVGRLVPFAEYIRSDSANWRMAMYCRTFPELLWLLAAAAGADELPIHMLRMVLPENVERSLRVAEGHLSSDDWMTLGQRALGEEQFTAFVERQGRPICHVRLFGGLEVVADDRTIRERDWKKRKARLLFAMLVVRRGQDIPRDQILDHLWPDLTEDKARNNFYVAWSMMKNALVSPEKRAEGCPYVESIRGRCRIVRESVRSDVDEFEELMAASREAEAAGRPESAIAALQELMSVYRGELLPGDVYDDWFSALRDKYRFEFIDAMVRGAEMLLERDDPCEALVFARTALNVDRYREDLYQLALRCHIAAGQRSAAIETFIQCKTQLAEELGLDPGKETIELYRTVLVMEERPRHDSYGLNAE